MRSNIVLSAVQKCLRMQNYVLLAENHNYNILIFYLTYFHFIIVIIKIDVLLNNKNMVNKITLLVPIIIISTIIGILGVIYIPSEIKNKNLDFSKGAIKLNDKAG